MNWGLNIRNHSVSYLRLKPINRHWSLDNRSINFFSIHLFFIFSADTRRIYANPLDYIDPNIVSRFKEFSWKFMDYLFVDSVQANVLKLEKTS
jgi:hypothetical protein